MAALSPRGRKPLAARFASRLRERQPEEGNFPQSKRRREKEEEEEGSSSSSSPRKRAAERGRGLGCLASGCQAGGFVLKEEKRGRKRTFVSRPCRPTSGVVRTRLKSGASGNGRWKKLWLADAPACPPAGSYESDDGLASLPLLLLFVATEELRKEPGTQENEVAPDATGLQVPFKGKCVSYVHQ